MCTYMYIYVPNHRKTQTHGIAWSYVDSSGCLFCFLYFYFEKKIGFRAASVSESVLFDF